MGNYLERVKQLERNRMRNYFDSDVRHAVEVLNTASAGVRLEAAGMILRKLVLDPTIGLHGREFLRETESGLQTVLDWIAVGHHEGLQNTKINELEAETLS